MKILIIIGFLFSSTTALLAQSRKMNRSELIAKIKTSQPDTNRISLLLTLSKYYCFDKDGTAIYGDSCFTLLREANELGEITLSAKWRNESRRILGQYFFKRDDTKSGKNYFLKIINEFKAANNIKAEMAIWEELSQLIPSRDTVPVTKIDCFKKIILLCQQTNNDEKEIETLKSIADVHLTNGRLDTAEAELLRVLKRFQGINYSNLHYTYDLLSVTYRQKGDFNKALFYGLKSVESMEATGDTYAIIVFYSRLANMYRELDQPENSVKWYWKVFQERKYVGPVNLYMFRDAGFLARELIKLQKRKEALAFITDIANKNEPIGIYARASLSATLAYCYHRLQQHARADKYYLEAIGFISNLEKDNEVTADVNYEAGKYFYDRGQYAKAIHFLQNALEVSPGINSPSTVKDIYLNLYQADSAQGNLINAINHLQKYQVLKDSIFNEVKSKQIEELGIKYESAQKQKDIQVLSNQNQLQQIQFSQANMTKNITLATAALLTVIIALLYKGYWMKQRSNAKLQLHQKEIDDKNLFLENMNERQGKLLQEKEWLIKEVHHRVKNNLQMVVSLLHTQAAYLNNDAAIRAIQQSEHRMQAMSLIHQKLYQAENVSAIDMSVYINELIQYLKDIFNVGSHLQVQQYVEAIELDVAQAVPVGLILNEAITNAIKYGLPGIQAAVISVSMYYENAGNLVLSISDNGKGLPEDIDLAAHNTLGMNLMQWLAKQLGGSCVVRNNDGVEVIIRFKKDNRADSQDTDMINSKPETFLYG